MAILCLLPCVCVHAAVTNVSPAGTTNRMAPDASKSTHQLISGLSSALRSGRVDILRTILMKLRDRKAEHRIDPALRLGVYFRTGDTRRLQSLLKNNPSLKTTSGSHRVYLAQYAFDRKDFDNFYRHIIASMESVSKQQEGFLYRSISALEEKSYARALLLLQKIDRSNVMQKDLALRLSSFIHLKMENFQLAYRAIRKLYATKTRIPKKAMKLLFHLSLKISNGMEAVYWAGQMLKQDARLHNDPIFNNNYCIALSLKLKTQKKPVERVALIKTLLASTEKLLKQKRDANALHTASVAYESANMLHKAVEMIRLCRALKPRHKGYLTRHRTLEKKLKAQIRKAGRRK